MEGEPPPVEERRRLQQELSEFVESCCRRLEEVTASLGWSLDRLDPGEEAAQDEVVICPYDSNHHMPKSSLAKHMVSCRLRKLGYTKEEEDQMYNSDFFYENVKIPSITLNKDSQFQIIKQARTAVGKDGDGYNQRIYSSLPVEVPLNHKRCVCDLTQADRLALYDFVVEETKKKRSDSQIIENDSDLFVDLAAKVNQDNSRKSPKSYLEILAEVRDYKRRRQSYRAKNVHITKKSYTEVIRDVINVHMEELSSHWQEEQRAEDDAEKNEERRSASVDSRQSGGSYLDAEYSRHRKDRSRSPHKRKRNKDKDKNWDSRRRKDRDGERHHSHKRRKQKI
ncbi:U11/U12 small nuclear ribonucleoprotein 48 kDa protein [Mustela nigripes]|uniref:U11/U12 small nuclear ribonucleoprotein 48 kDa protein n=3 Tax=Mustela putorius furo TaxID=9669 RepID=A0A8U0MSV2_MUSPF|nr:U11/U12 small nuclear ribonucleoprotein 48 kDa protein [Mustela putorius furo]XP_032196949.1 U11/U12 small nuclear ribonucleoprotein 48 kDa protein [Mustela erminea]XP_059035196.1 U11/U12 small nuclear ribonucleoprotein 48 kDa protein [Mustela lutreola]XP_059257602.1 U11/U12 small nuclear ribonucleoprotein 48 kDa protein [Mustela nigripes]